MGNCFHLLQHRATMASDGKVLRMVKTDGKFLECRALRIVTTDGKVLEYRASLLVKDLLLNFEGCRVGSSKEASQHLPENYELKVGKIYYLLPSVADTAAADVCGVDKSSVNTADQSGGFKRMKLVVTKQQLQELLSKKISVEQMLSTLQNGAWDSGDSVTGWRPALETIPEGTD